MMEQADISPRVISPEQLAHMLNQVRADNPAEGELWPLLVHGLNLVGQEHVLSAALEAFHGIVVLDDEILQHAESEGVIGVEYCLVRVRDARQAWLLCDDPWSPAAVRCMARERGDRQLALAKPGQTALILRKDHSSSYQADRGLRDESVSDSLTTAGESPVVQFVDDAIRHAYIEGASDIHFETNRDGVGLKFRLDGVMTLGKRLNDPQKAQEIISRIKVMAQLDITECRRPQDGRIHWQGRPGEAVDLRASIMPSIFGEDAVLRLLDKAQLRQTDSDFSLESLGFSNHAAQPLRRLAHRPHGMLLVTGPTGSGKTTTIYAALTEVNDGLEKIITIEDPVEYELPGVLQIPVNEQKGLTFATGLRSILRHDPDKILVGEIRDSETAQIAVQSSLTGHLVFTTVHANSFSDVLGRFRHFGIEPFALASALNGVVVQRLLRKLCPHCWTLYEPDDWQVDAFNKAGMAVPTHLPRPGGCERCRGTGYKGRFVVAEVHTLTDELRDLIVQGASMTGIKALVYHDHTVHLLSQALHRVAAGETTFEEVTRVVGMA